MTVTNCLTAIDFPRFFGRLIQPFTLWLFNLTGEDAFPLITGLGAGYPMGVKTTAQLYKNGSITKSTAQRLLLFCNNPGALFITGTVGMGVFGDAKTGYFILFCCYLPPVLLAVLSGLFSAPANTEYTYIPPKPLTQENFAFAISDSIRSLLMIGGYIIIFSVISAVFEKLHIFDGLARLFSPFGLPAEINKALSMGILEMTNGCALAGGSGKIYTAAAAAILSWGGLSVHAQSLEFTADTDLKTSYYFAGRLICGILSFMTAYFAYDVFI
ncbi:MAG: hypothetical protein IJL89_01375 [Firmicutes bacterium]|nr:hypothetical protein [Bacillota bacterium]